MSFDKWVQPCSYHHNQGENGFVSPLSSHESLLKSLTLAVFEVFLTNPDLSKVSPRAVGLALFQSSQGPSEPAGLTVNSVHHADRQVFL